MRRLDIIVEGQSEREFVSQTLAPYLESRCDINAYDVSAIVIRTNPNNRGGMSKYRHLKEDILKSLSSSNPELVVSTLIDFFRMPGDMPGRKSLEGLSSDCDKVEIIESEMMSDINDRRFIPYIQLHEFEAFLFSSVKGFECIYSDDDQRLNYLCNIVKDYPNPETINTSPDGAPSKRIQAVVPEYDKVIDGNLIIECNGINAILDTCPRFKIWTENLIRSLS